MSERDEFESAYVAHVNAQNISNVLGQHGCTVEEIAAMRYGDSYNVGGIGMHDGYLNGCWDGWKLARAPQALPALTAHNCFTQRVIDIAYTAFMAAKQPNKEDGGLSDWFMDARPVVLAAIEKLRKDLLAAAPQPSPAPEKAAELLLAACHRAAMALAHASEHMPQYDADYQAVSDAIAAHVEGGAYPKYQD